MQHRQRSLLALSRCAPIGVALVGIAQACSILSPIMPLNVWQGLRAIHALGRLHGDLRGPNVILADDGEKVGIQVDNSADSAGYRQGSELSIVVVRALARAGL